MLEGNVNREDWLEQQGEIEETTKSKIKIWATSGELSNCWKKREKSGKEHHD